MQESDSLANANEEITRINGGSGCGGGSRKGSLPTTPVRQSPRKRCPIRNQNTPTIETTQKMFKEIILNDNGK